MTATTGDLEERTLRKVRRRIMPLIVLLYFIAYLDRNNVGFARITMSEDIGLSAAAFGVGAGIFFVGYALLEIPSNAGMYKFGARKWLTRSGAIAHPQHATTSVSGPSHTWARVRAARRVRLSQTGRPSCPNCGQPLVWRST